jgi:ferredoxin
MGVQVRLDQERCQGHGRCYILASGVFECDADGRGMVIAETVPRVLAESARLGSDNCPEDAITVIDD